MPTSTNSGFIARSYKRALKAALLQFDGLNQRQQELVLKLGIFSEFAIYLDIHHMKKTF